MVSKLEDVMNQLSELDQLRANGAVTEDELQRLKEEFLTEAMPGVPGPAPIATELPVWPSGGAFRRLMPVLVIFGLAMLVMAYPLVKEGTPNACRALEQSELRASAATNAPYSNLPSAIGCVVGYYRFQIHGESAGDLAKLDAPVIPPAAVQKPSPQDQTLNAPSPESLAGNAAPDNLQTVPPATQAQASPQPLEDLLPKVVGECSETTVTKVGTRLEDPPGTPVPGTGSAIQYENSGAQVSYDQIGGIDTSEPGDRVQLCLTAVPANCPPGDNRGKVYHALNLRTGADWDAPDSEHSCGGT